MHRPEYPEYTQLSIPISNFLVHSIFSCLKSVDPQSVVYLNLWQKLILYKYTRFCPSRHNIIVVYYAVFLMSFNFHHRIGEQFLLHPDLRELGRRVS